MKTTTTKVVYVNSSSNSLSLTYLLSIFMSLSLSLFYLFIYLSYDSSIPLHFTLRRVSAFLPFPPSHPLTLFFSFLFLSFLFFRTTDK
ncbi:hypothetical protein F5X96DRAFT_657463 [Biscogniauxia mediterranea]|nr:hypothetical protein F5X96DRAFT_657463 [Biscogniauxia mediterranea]